MFSGAASPEAETDSNIQSKLASSYMHLIQLYSVYLFSYPMKSDETSIF